jgi:hypothetical protein
LLFEVAADGNSARQGEEQYISSLRAARDLRMCLIDGRRTNMFGWMILFAIMAILGTGATLAHPAAFSAMAGLMFGFLFFLGLMTRLVRGRGW